MLGVVLVLGLLAVAIGAPHLTRYDPYRLNPLNPLTTPSRAHILGTDELGRDIFTRVIFGARISLTTGVVTVALAGLVGILLGSVSGVARGMVDNLIMRAADIFLAFPALILAMAVVAALGAGLQHAMVAIVFVWWPGYARLVRGQVLATVSRLFVEAAYAMGATKTRAVLRHILPQIVSPILVKASLDVGHAILLASSLGFVGLGASPPIPEWGTMLATARIYLLDQWWYATSVGFAIFVSVLSFSLMGEGLADLLDPRHQYGP